MRKLLWVVIASFLAAGAALAQGAAKAVTWPAADMKWMPMVDGPPGAQAVALWGDMTKGAYGAMLKFPAGFSVPLHTHTSDMRSVIVSGTWIHTPEGKPPVRLGPGSYLMQPGGSYRHATACDKASECVIFSESDGKFDLLPVK
jgi:anti-sigma factor ChrR (cupin superfamily)